MRWVGLILCGVILSSCNGLAAPVKVTFGTDATFPPYESVDMNTKELVGFDIELMKAIAARASLQVEFVNVSYTPLMGGIARCQFDGGISAIPVSDGANQPITLSEPYFSAGQVVVVKKGNLAITGRDQLAGMVVGSQKGTPGAAEIGKIAGAQFKSYDSFNLAFDDLIRGLIDAVVADNPLALSYVSVRPYNLKIVGDEFAAESYAIALCNQRAELVKRINDGIAGVKADGTLNSLVQKWIVKGGK